MQSADMILVRDTFTEYDTTGRLYLGRNAIGAPDCLILEDRVRLTDKVPRETAIPFGTYDVVITMSPRFKRELPLLLNVPGFAGIRIHSGNTAGDTEGCLLPGMSRILRNGRQVVINSRAAFDRINQYLKRQIAAGAAPRIHIRGVSSVFPATR